MFQATFPQHIGQSLFPFSFYHCREKVIHCTWWSGPKKNFKTPLFWFLRLFWRISLYFVLAGIICSSMECSLSGSIKMHLFLTWSNTGCILNNLLLIFSGFSCSELSLTCKHSLNFWYLCDICNNRIPRFISPIHTKIREIDNWHVHLYPNKLFNHFCSWT